MTTAAVYLSLNLYIGWAKNGLFLKFVTPVYVDIE